MDRIISQKQQSDSLTQSEIKLDVGYLFKHLEVHNLEGPDIPLTDYALVEYEINGTVVMSLTGTELDNINRTDGLPAYDGQELLLPFGLEKMKDQRMRELTFINTGIKSPVSGKIVASHTLRITWATAHKVNVWALVSEQTADGPGLIRRFQRGSQQAGVGDTELTTLTKGTAQFGMWRRVFTTPSAGNITHQEINTPRAKFWGTKVPVPVANALAKAGDKNPGLFGAMIDFSCLNSGYNALARTDGKGAVTPDTPDIPFLPTLALKDDTLSVVTWNDTAGVNTFILEAVGEID